MLQITLCYQNLTTEEEFSDDDPMLRIFHFYMHRIEHRATRKRSKMIVRIVCTQTYDLHSLLRRLGLDEGDVTRFGSDVTRN
mgnify:CR=1 FL=1